MPRFLIIGCSGSGKSTLAEQISSLHGIPYINTDRLFWRRDWSVVSEEEVLQAIDLDAESYVLDGNFAANRDTVWSKVDVIVWLDYARHLVMYRLFKRNMGWWLRRHSPWTDTPMSFLRACSGLLHGFRSHGKKRKSYPAFLSAFPEKEICIVTSPREADALLGLWARDDYGIV